MSFEIEAGLRELSAITIKSFETQLLASSTNNMSKKIGGYTESHLVNVAREAVAKKTKNTVVLDQEAEDRIPKFANEGVCFVHNLVAVRLLRRRSVLIVPFSLSFSLSPETTLC